MENYIFKGMPIYDETAFLKIETIFYQNESQVLSHLPWLASELINEIGFKEAILFIFREGGKRIYIGKDQLKFEAKLELDLPTSLFDRITSFSSGGYLEIPSPWGVSERFRKSIIISSYIQGVPEEELQRIYGITSRALTDITRAKKKAKKN